MLFVASAEPESSASRAPIGKARRRALSTLEPGQNLGDAKKVCSCLRHNLNLSGEDTLTTPSQSFTPDLLTNFA